MTTRRQRIYELRTEWLRLSRPETEGAYVLADLTYENPRFCLFMASAGNPKHHGANIAIHDTGMDIDVHEDWVDHEEFNEYLQQTEQWLEEEV